MRRTDGWLRITGPSFALLLAFSSGCATQTQTRTVDVGEVVIAPRPQLPPIPQVVQDLEPYPAGYFQHSLLRYFKTSPSEPTP